MRGQHCAHRLRDRGGTARPTILVACRGGGPPRLRRAREASRG
jgi:hypothetical protein